MKRVETKASSESSDFKMSERQGTALVTAALQDDLQMGLHKWWICSEGYLTVEFVKKSAWEKSDPQRFCDRLVPAMRFLAGCCRRCLPY